MDKNTQVIRTMKPSAKRGGTAADAVSDALVEHLGERKYDLWFGEATKMVVRGRRLRVAAQSQIVADRITSQFNNLLEQAARDAIGEDAIVEVAVDPDANGRATATTTNTNGVNHTASVTRRTRTRNGSTRSSLHLPLRHRFGDFVVGRSNELAYSAAVRIAEGAESPDLGPLFIHGECGLGKTHLLQAICHHYIDRVADARVRYTTGEQFTNEYIAAIRGNRVDTFRRRVRGLDLLAIDDIHFLSNKTSTQTEFLHTLDAIDLSGARIIMASDEHPRHLRCVNRALVSRFLAGMVIEIERPDRAMRIELVGRMSAARGLTLNEQAIDRIAARCAGSVREIEGAINKLAAMVTLAGDRGEAEVGCVAVDQLFKAEPRSKRPLRIGDIVSTVCERLSVDRGDLFGATRHARVVLARGLVSYLARELTTMSYPEIGRALGRRTHTTVLTASRRVAGKIEERETVELDGEIISLQELSDQLRHQIQRSSPD